MRHSPLATPSYPARRLREEPDSDHRTPFQRDRDRIVHSKAFRRLKHKTQVFIAPEGDHYRTRLTHTLETCGIARKVARALGLNEDLTEAIGLGHDLGHPPFGHVGEEVLDQCVRERWGHALPPQRALAAHGRRDRAHSTSPSRCATGSCTTPAPSRRPRRRAGSCGWWTGSPTSTTTSTTPSAPACCASSSCRAPRSSCSARPARSASRRSSSTCWTAPRRPATSCRGRKSAARCFACGSSCSRHVYLGPEAQRQKPRIERLLRALFDHYAEHPPPPLTPDASEEQRVVDWLAGMTDRFAIRAFADLSLPQGF